MTRFRWTILAAVLFVLLSNFGLLTWGLIRCADRAAAMGSSMAVVCPGAGEGYGQATSEILSLLFAMGAFSGR